MCLGYEVLVHLYHFPMHFVCNTFVARCFDGRLSTLPNEKKLSAFDNALKC